MSELKKNIVLSEIKNGRQVFFLEKDKKRFFLRKTDKIAFDIRRAQYLITQNWSTTHTAQTKQTHKIEAKIMAFT